MTPLFPNGYRGLADSRWSGVEGSVAESVGIDAHSTPGLMKVHQKLSKDSASVIDELCNAAVSVSDGSKLWFSSESGKIWRENGGTYTLMYELVMEAYNVLTAILDGSYDGSTEETQHKIQMSPDGLNLLTVGRGDTNLNHYELSTAKDVTSASLADSTSISAQVSSARSLFVRDDGLKMFVATPSAVFQYTLGTAWDGSTRSYDSKTYDFSSLTTSIESIWLNSDGTKIFILETDGTIFQYTLGTAWDISTVEGGLDALVVAAGGGGAAGATATNDGAGGGGGAGQLLEEAVLPQVGSYAISVGTGGAGGTGDGGSGSKGGDSAFGSILTAEGGGYGSAKGTAGGDGGNGGGAHDGTAGTGDNNGGRQTVASTSTRGAGGGAGSGGAGSDTNNDTGGAGGVGTSSSITGSPVTYAAGGAGATTSAGAGTAGAANTGDGGEGSGQGNDGAAGGSGIVVISYPTGSLTATGGTITTSGGNTIHTFTSDGTFEVTAVSGHAAFTKTEGTTATNYGMAFSADGTRLIIGNANTIFQYTLGTAWDISSATYDNINIPFPSAESSTQGVMSLDFDNDGSTLYVARVNTGFIFQYDLATGTEGAATLSAVEFKALNRDSESEQSPHIVWTTEHYVFKIAVSALADWDEEVSVVGRFTNGDDTYHPLVVQNASLFIGDAQTIAQYDSLSVFYASTSFNVTENERIQAIERFDIDVIVGTSYGEYARILRWDTVSDSWSSEDYVFESGISAFIRDDNFVYAYAGNQGRIYFYNGEKLERFTRVRGDWNASNTAIVRSSSIGYYNGVPVFGLSTGAGTPCKIGVYTLGSFSPSYPIALDLAYPLGNTYDTLQFGAILIDGNDMYVSAEDGVYAVDHANKYEYAHIETRQLSGRRGSTHTKYIADYVSLPASTDITFSYRDKYANSFTAMDSILDEINEQVRAELSVPDVTSLQLRIDLTVNGNDAPEVEQYNVK